MMTTFKRTDRYKTAINELADAIAEMPIKELAAPFAWKEIDDDLNEALETRHRRFKARLDNASYMAFTQWEAERRSKGARKAAATRAKQRAAAKQLAAQT
jgi:hypothetical protein